MKNPEPPDDSENVITQRHWKIFGIGLCVYVVGFLLLARGLANLSPFVIVAGILAMLAAFLN